MRAFLLFHKGKLTGVMVEELANTIEDTQASGFSAASNTTLREGLAADAANRVDIILACNRQRH